MGFLDRAKQAAEQAQKKLDEVQNQRNAAGRSSAADGSAVQYDQHGRPVPAEQLGVEDPPQPESAAPAISDPAPSGEPLEPPRPPAAPKGPPSSGSGLTGGDPLAG